jgi:hypothetical protein
MPVRAQRQAINNLWMPLSFGPSQKLREHKSEN